MYQVPKSISSLRQLSSGFGKACTFAAWRATLDCLDTDLLQPTTIFTIADIPSNQGYGVSDTSIAKTASRILQYVATAVMSGRCLSNEEIKNVIDQFTPNIQQNPAIVALLAHLKTRVTKTPLGYCYIPVIHQHTCSQQSVSGQLKDQYEH
ncbi:hypothetical protein DFQ28_007646 [Apophysomyces sp. BC1034]|nr:hypothetical protein DFQ29_008284 [Apophysomyces sp. BC1021]KAG0186531.1 hypothetical protein DFQ28_007646 [Apophysomyces sp. BC1034]